MRLKKTNKKPPLLAIWLLNKITKTNDYHFALGDFTESFEMLAREKGSFLAKCWFWFEVLRSLPKFLKNSFYWSIMMFKNYLKVAFRNIMNQKMYSLINITGLAIGMACFIVIFLFVQFDFSFDRFHEHSDRIYRLCANVKVNNRDLGYSTVRSQAVVPFKEELPEITNAVRLTLHRGSITNYKNKRFNVYLIYTEPSFLDIFSIQFIFGDPKTALSSPNSVVITEEMAEKYFGDEHPLGKIITVKNKDDYTVTGVVKRLPKNSHFHFDILTTFKNYYHPEYDDSKLGSVHTYLLLHKTINKTEFEQKINKVIKNKLGEKWAKRYKFFIQPLTSIHLSSNLALELERNSDKKQSIYFTILALIIMLVACINFMNLSSARSLIRSKEVGIRKVSGAFRTHIIKQFLIEALIMSLIACCLGLVFAYFLLPLFNQVSHTNLEIELVHNYALYNGMIVIIFVVGLFTGSYPAILLSAFKPANV